MIGKPCYFKLVTNACVDCQLVNVTDGFSRILVIDVDNLINRRLIGERLRIEEGSLIRGFIRYNIHGTSVPRLPMRHVGCSSIRRGVFHVIVVPRHEVVSHGGLISRLKGRFVPGHIVIQRFLFAAKSSVETLVTSHLGSLIALEKPSVVSTSHQLLPLVEAACFRSLSLQLHEIRTGGGHSSVLAFLRIGRFHFLI